MGDNETAITGGCLCGAVRYTIAEGAQRTSVCHCSMCRRWTGGPVMGIHPKKPARLDQAETLTWYGSSEWAERGFCGTCGTTLFYRLRHTPDDLIPAAGSLDDPNAVTGIERHIFIDEKPEFYDFSDTAPRLTGEELVAAFNAEHGTDY